MCILTIHTLPRAKVLLVCKKCIVNLYDLIRSFTKPNKWGGHLDFKMLSTLIKKTEFDCFSVFIAISER